MLYSGNALWSINRFVQKLLCCKSTCSVEKHYSPGIRPVELSLSRVFCCDEEDGISLELVNPCCQPFYEYVELFTRCCTNKLGTLPTLNLIDECCTPNNVIINLEEDCCTNKTILNIENSCCQRLTAELELLEDCCSLENGEVILGIGNPCCSHQIEEVTLELEEICCSNVS